MTDPLTLFRSGNDYLRKREIRRIRAREYQRRIRQEMREARAAR